MNHTKLGFFHTQFGFYLVERIKFFRRQINENFLKAIIRQIENRLRLEIHYDWCNDEWHSECNIHVLVYPDTFNCHTVLPLLVLFNKISFFPFRFSFQNKTLQSILDKFFQTNQTNFRINILDVYSNEKFHFATKSCMFIKLHFT